MHETAAAPLECWLPDLGRFPADHPCRTLLLRADRVPAGAKGYLDSLAQYFVCEPEMAPAALTRQLLVGDAADAAWLCADPAWVEPDMNGARLLACGRMQLSMDEARALAEPLAPVFAEAGMQLVLSSPDHWHLRLNAAMSLPALAAPEQALGEDLYEHLPQGQQGRRWRVLLNEVQVLLHQHPINTQRRARGLPPINSLWLWGAGTLPTRVNTILRGVIGEDVLLLALAKRAGIPAKSRDVEAVNLANANELIDLQDQTVDQVADTWWPCLQQQAKRQPLVLAFASGERWLHRPWHRLRYWRRASR